jgi:hypothetical protein
MLRINFVPAPRFPLGLSVQRGRAFPNYNRGWLKTLPDFRHTYCCRRHLCGSHCFRRLLRDWQHSPPLLAIRVGTKLAVGSWVGLWPRLKAVGDMRPFAARVATHSRPCERRGGRHTRCQVDHDFDGKQRPISMPPRGHLQRLRPAWNDRARPAKSNIVPYIPQLGLVIRIGPAN